MSLAKQAALVARLLKDKGIRVVFAESCTAGLASASLATQPGISEFHCGGMIVYRNGTKSAYLGISAKQLQQSGAVSSGVAEAMATSVLAQTPEAEIAAAVTGHLGPGSEPPLDGRYFIAVARRATQSRTAAPVRVLACDCRHRGRTARQREVAERLLDVLANTLSR